MTFDSMRLYVVHTEGKKAFYGMRLQAGNDDDIVNWLIVDKLGLVPVDFFEDSNRFKEKYKIVEGSDMKLGATLIWEKCKKVSEDFSPEIFRQVMKCSDSIVEQDAEIIGNHIESINFMYEEAARKLTREMTGKIIHFEDITKEYYVVCDNIVVSKWPYDEKQFFPDFVITGSMLVIDHFNFTASFDLTENKAFLGYADEIMLRDKSRIPQNFEVLERASNDMCMKAEETFKRFMETLKLSKFYAEVIDSEKPIR